MTFAEGFEVLDAGEGRWDVQLRETFLVAGQIWRTATGYLLRDWADRELGTFSSLADALRALWELQPPSRYA